MRSRLLGWGKQIRIEPFRYVSAADQRRTRWCWVANRSNRKYELKRFGRENEPGIAESRRKSDVDARILGSSRRGALETPTRCRGFATRVLFLSCRPKWRHLLLFGPSREGKK